MSRVTSILLLSLFALLIGAPGVAWIAGVKGGGTALQNRTLNKRPPFTFKKVWDASWGKEFTDWVWDAIPLRDKALSMNHWIDFYGFRDSPSKDAFFGLEGWNWRRERVLEGIRAGGGDPKDITKALDKIEKAFADAGVPVYIVLSPTKGSIYPEFLPPRYRAEFEKIARPAENTFRERAKTDPAIIDLWTPMLEEKARLLALPESELLRPEFRYLWRRNDDHWNVEAGRIQAREIVKKIDPALWSEENAPTITGQVQDLESELSRLYFKLDITEPYQGQKTSPNVKIKLVHKNVKGSTNPITITTSEVTETNAPADLNILVMRDSFLSEHGGAPSCTRDAGVQTIAPFFKRVVFMHWETLQTGKQLVKPRVRGVDRVVIQVTQGSNYYLVKRANELVGLAKMIKEGLGQEDDGKDPLEPQTTERKRAPRPQLPATPRLPRTVPNLEDDTIDPQLP